MIVENGFLTDGQDGCVIPMGFARRKPVVELEFDLDGAWRGDEQESTDLRPFINDRKELLFEKDFSFVGIEPMDAEAWSGIIGGFYFWRATIPCGNNYGDGILR